MDDRTFRACAQAAFVAAGHMLDEEVEEPGGVDDFKVVVMECAICYELFSFDSDTMNLIGGRGDRCVNAPCQVTKAVA